MSKIIGKYGNNTDITGNNNDNSVANNSSYMKKYKYP